MSATSAAALPASLAVLETGGSSAASSILALFAGGSRDSASAGRVTSGAGPADATWCGAGTAGDDGPTGSGWATGSGCASSCIDNIKAAFSSSSISSMATMPARGAISAPATGMDGFAEAGTASSGTPAASFAAGAVPPSSTRCSLARSSSMEIRNAIANSGSSPPPNSKSSPPPPIPMSGDSPSGTTIGDVRRTSLRSLGPTGTSNKCEESLLLTALTSLLSFAEFSSISP
mmetsp:Transcript_18523/g.49692  ORF Transcript_18523/g.49692 Transcript_18523/m.49692 type:complete len:232 (+) Transcript_18523:361-1056(+)